jgi:hypothetical protein
MSLRVIILGYISVVHTSYIVETPNGCGHFLLEDNSGHDMLSHLHQARQSSG